VKHTAVFTVRSPAAREIYRSLAPEAGEIGQRSEVRVTLDGDDCLVLSVTAEDIPSLRAALNMWLRLISVSGEMIGITVPAGRPGPEGTPGPEEPGLSRGGGAPWGRDGAGPGGRGPSGRSRDLPGGKGAPQEGIAGPAGSRDLPGGKGPPLEGIAETGAGKVKGAADPGR
jgi:KEOPS complex subunit Pcc1